MTVVNPAFEQAWQGRSYTSCTIETQTGFWNFGGLAEQNQYLNLWFLTLHEMLGIHWFKLKNWDVLFFPSMCRKGEDKTQVFLSRLSKHRFVVDLLNDEEF